MPGLLETQQPTQPTPPTSGALKRIAEDTERKLAEKNPEMKETYDSIVMAGMKAMWDDDGTNQQMTEYLQMVKQDPSKAAQLVAHGIMKLLSYILPESGLSKEEFMGPSTYAAIIFMTQVLEYLHKQMGLPIDNELIAQTTKAISQGLFELYDITPEQIDEAMTRQSQQEKGGPPSAPQQSPQQPAPAAPAPGGNT